MKDIKNNINLKGNKKIRKSSIKAINRLYRQIKGHVNELHKRTANFLVNNYENPSGAYHLHSNIHFEYEVVNKN